MRRTIKTSEIVRISSLFTGIGEIRLGFERGYKVNIQSFKSQRI